MRRPARDGYRLLVFDWDGTLMDSISTIVACTRCALAEAGVEPPDEALVRRAIGMSLADSMELFFPGADATLRARMIESYRRHWLESYKDQPRLFPDAERTLRGLQDSGYLLAIATAKGRAGLARELEATALAELIVATRTADDGPAKPHPAMLQALMNELGASPGATLMIGDTRWDLEMASNAGVGSIAVESGSHPRADLLAAGPLACLAGVGELPAWLASRG